MNDTAVVEPRCRVCRDDKTREKVNSLLAKGLSFAAIARAAIGGGEAISEDSVRRHADRHFPVQHVAGATYREIVERRAREQQLDLEEGVRTALTPLAYFEAVMLKAFENLVDDKADVSIQAGLSAAAHLQEAAASSSDGMEIARVMVQMDQVIRAVRETVPEELWPEIVERLKGTEDGY
ncbi:hypothetical protein NCCP2495_28040 [Dietzia sp. NCCP-2495]|uniref:hypothetical protein n=1 Tax=Dietzia sp. NCCP-2495 TaxID=2934675 RepID=UPI0022321A11|nr:hypothetical protein [Dietzia sp. NCCP-2495]GLB64924.1 hypothetical protein NCCP2495_28040 [Dietzia sp. NCCP-2495]